MPLMIALILQIPWISSPFLTFSFSAGLRITIGIVGGSVSASYRFGSDWQFFLLADRPWGVGINVSAIIVLILLLSCSRTHNAAQAAAPIG